jgi:hypothetical protein
MVRNVSQKTEEKRSFERPRYKWKNIKMNIKETVCEDVGCIYLLMIESG